MDAKAKTFFETLQGRRSIRVFRPGVVDDATVKLLLEAAMAAPSAVAKDPWRFVVVRNAATLSQIAEMLPNGRMIATVPVGIVVCGDLNEAHDRQLSYLLQDCSAAVQNLLLAAHALGLGTCWLGVHPREDRIRNLSHLLGLPKNVLPIACIALGWPGEDKEARTRYRDSSVHLEKW